MSVTQYYDRLNDDAVARFRDDRDTFRLEDYPDGESILVYGQECLLIGDLAVQATLGVSEKELVSGAVSGFAGAPVDENDDYPFLLDRRVVVLASRLLNDLRPEDLRGEFDLGRLKARYHEVEEWLWEEWGPDVFEDRLLPKFEMVRGLYRRAAERNQQMIVGWF